MANRKKEGRRKEGRTESDCLYLPLNSRDASPKSEHQVGTFFGANIPLLLWFFFFLQQYFLIFRMRRAFCHTKWISRIFLCAENFIYLSAHRNLLGLLKLQGVLCRAELANLVLLSLAIDIIRRMSSTCWHLGKPREEEEEAVTIF